MSFKASGFAAITASFLAACAGGQSSQGGGTAFIPQTRLALGCYGTFGVEAMPCPVKLTKRNGGAVAVSVNGPGVVLAVVIAGDCAGPGSPCDVVQAGYTQFEISSVRGQNSCGNGYVVFEALTASASPVGTATVKVVNKYC